MTQVKGLANILMDILDNYTSHQNTIHKLLAHLNTAVQCIW